MATALAPGTVLGDTYELERQIGKGGMGVVWSARHLRLPGRKLAIKILTQVELDEAQVARFRREAQIASRLDHPGIVRVSDFNVLPGGQAYLVMELLPGRSLAARLKEGPLPLAEALELTRQMAEALEAAHQAGVVHRDLKPDNVFLCDGAIKLLDFGISKLAQATLELTGEAQVLGTPRYMAPEQARGEAGGIGPATDVFSLGAVVYEMLAGRPAFAGQSVPEIMFKVVFQPHPPLEGVPPHVARAVDRALAKEARDRFATPAAFVVALEAPPRRSRAGIILGGLIALGVLVSVVVVSLGFRERQATPLVRADAAPVPPDAAPPDDAAIPDAAPPDATVRPDAAPPPATPVPATPAPSKPPPRPASNTAPLVILDLSVTPGARGRDEAVRRALTPYLPRLGHKKIPITIEVGPEGDVQEVYGASFAVLRGMQLPPTPTGFQIQVHVGPRP